MAGWAAWSVLRSKAERTRGESSSTREAPLSCRQIGDARSLAIHPATTTHSQLYARGTARDRRDPTATCGCRSASSTSTTSSPTRSGAEGGGVSAGSAGRVDPVRALPDITTSPRARPDRRSRISRNPRRFEAAQCRRRGRERRRPCRRMFSCCRSVFALLTRILPTDVIDFLPQELALAFPIFRIFEPFVGPADLRAVNRDEADTAEEFGSVLPGVPATSRTAPSCSRAI